MRQWSFSVKYSTRPNNARDRSPKVKRSPHFNFQKHHRPQQNVNTYHTGNSTQHFWIIQSLWSYSQCTSVSADGHTTAIITLSTLTSTSTITSAIFHSSWTIKTSQPVQPAESAQISRLVRTSRTNQAILRAIQIFQKQLTSYMSAQKQAHRPTLTPPHSTQKNCVNE